MDSYSLHLVHSRVIYDNTYPNKFYMKSSIKVDHHYHLMKVKSLVEHSAILLTFIKLPFIIKSFLSNFERPFYTDFTVLFVTFIVLQSFR